MSRSRSSGCPCGRGCRACGDAGAARRERDAHLGELDLAEPLPEADDDGPDYCGDGCTCGYTDEELVDTEPLLHQAFLAARVATPLKVELGAVLRFDV